MAHYFCPSFGRCISSFGDAKETKFVVPAVRCPISLSLDTAFIVQYIRRVQAGAARLLPLVVLL